MALAAPTVKVRSTRISQDEKSPFVEYQVEFTVGDLTHTIFHRFSRIREFHFEMEELKIPGFPTFPSRRGTRLIPSLHLVDSNEVKERAVQLEKYFEDLIKNPQILGCERVNNFLEIPFAMRTIILEYLSSTTPSK